MLSDSKDDLVQRALELLKKRPQPKDTASPVQSGSFVAWASGDGTRPEAFVDAIHTDDTGTRWAFVSLPGGNWAAVNVKFLKAVNP